MSINLKKITIINAINKNEIIKNTREIPNTNTSDLNRKFNLENNIDEKTELENYIKDNDINN
jgi:hypothetical protein